MAKHASVKRTGGAAHVAAAVVLTVLALVPAARAGTEDICGCADSPSLGEFNSMDEESYPPGTTRSGSFITIPLSADGRFVFDSFTLGGVPGNPTSGVNVRFVVDQDSDTAANELVRLLVKGDVNIPVSNTIDVSGFASAGTPNDPRGGIPGPGGFRGGDGAFQQTMLTRAGGYGLGPGGGRPGDADAAQQANLDGHDGTFVGNDELMPLIGGGGGGGGSVNSGRDDCPAGGGGGGGGAILIAANGTIFLDGSITSYGGGDSCSPKCSCATGTGRGGEGSGGAVRLVAEAIEGKGYVDTRSSAQPGRIRLEAYDISADLTTDPVATRWFSPIPEMFPRLAISTVNGESQSRANELPIAERPQGVFGQIDVVVSGSDPLTIGLTSDGVTGGVGVEVSAKRRTGGQRFTTSATLGNCSPGGQCTATAVFQELPAGTYFIEAKAVFGP